MIKVAVGILRNDGRVLACQRKKNARYGLKWEFPGGKVEPGESTEECLIRELMEELSIRVLEIGDVETEASDYDDGGRYEVAYCHVLRYEGKLANNVFETFRWVTPAELKRLDILDGNRPFVLRMKD
jgi:8-oxo-dGTP diphosphatase